MAKKPFTTLMEDELFDYIWRAVRKESLKTGKDITMTAWVLAACEEKKEREDNKSEN